MPVFLEQGVDAGDASVPGVLQVLQRQPPRLRLRLLPLQGVLRPHPLAVQELRLPRLDVAVQVGDQLLLVVAHASAEVGDAQVRLLAVPQVRLGDEDVPHGQHAQPANLLGRVEDDWREPTGHLGVQPNLDPSLDLVLTLDQQVKELLGVHRRLTVVRHQPNQSRVPLVGNLGEGGAAGGHEDLPDTVFKRLQPLVVHTQVRLSCALLGRLVLQRPHAVLVGEALGGHADLGQDADFKAAHGEQQVGVVPAVYADEAVVPVHGGHAAGQPVLQVPEHRPPQVHVVLHETHACITRPALAVVVPHNVLIVGIRVLCQVPLDEILAVVRIEAQQHVDLVDVAGVEANGMPRLRARVPEAQELVRHLRRPSDLTGTR
mmetsp:Transcript_15271/g.46146  ORF Transcript_15271/g.46146 Transcript_15271/m.46146 type:complete len:374 (-) Transcript_15271:3477-4598(-)